MASQTPPVSHLPATLVQPLRQQQEMALTTNSNSSLLLVYRTPKARHNQLLTLARPQVKPQAAASSLLIITHLRLRQPLLAMELQLREDLAAVWLV